MTNDQMREEFEDFASDQYEWPQAIQKSADGEYKLMATAEAWRYWQASRAALCVELPNPSQAMKLVMNYQEHLRQNVTGTTNWAANLGMHVVDECRAAIESTGVRTR